MRIIASLVIITAAAAFGFSSADRLKTRANMAKCMGGDISRLGALMDYKLMPVAELARHMNARAVPALWDDFASRLENGTGIEQAWNASLDWAGANVRGFSALGRDEREILLEFGSSLGMSDRKTQLANITHSAERLNKLAETLAGEYASKGKLYGSLGVLLGMAAALLVI